MKHKLPSLSYNLDNLEPYISKETLNYHYLKHHKIYVDNLNKLIIGTKFENMSLEDIVKNSISGPIFNNAAQVWNHNFYFNLLTGSFKFPEGKILGLIEKNFGSFEKFKGEFEKKALSNFGSGWTWLVLSESKKLEILNTSNARNFLNEKEKKHLLACDIWEHAYYIDVRNDRKKYLKNFWNVINWKKIEDII